MKRGDPYDPKRIKEGLEEIQRLFFGLGYIDFTYTPRININSTGKTVSYSFLLLPGRQYFFKRINISGSERTYDREIRSVLSPFVEEGKVFSSIALESAIHNLIKFLETKNLNLKDYEYKRSSSDGMVDIFIRLQPGDH